MPEQSDDWIPCFESNRTAIDYLTYSYITTGGTQARRKAHYIHSIKFYDNEPEEIDMPDASDTRRNGGTAGSKLIEHDEYSLLL